MQLAKQKEVEDKQIRIHQIKMLLHDKRNYDLNKNIP